VEVRTGGAEEQATAGFGFAQATDRLVGSATGLLGKAFIR
jgi:hypothetical protein